MRFRFATWNVNSLRARLERVEQWIATVEPDVVVLQETKLADDNFPALTFAAMGYETAHHGLNQWNGVAILSRVGIEDVVAGFDDGAPPDPDARIVWATCGGIRVASAYVPNGRSLDDDHYRYKLEWLARLRADLDRAHTPSQDLIVAGDFNIAPDDRDVWDPAEFAGATHVSEAEREALGEIEAWGLEDVFRRHHDVGGLFSWWDYRAGNFHKGKGMRIDLVLATKGLAEQSVSALVDRNARKGKQPSDHAPVIVDFER
jgi:exodeoxyribonuclease-3